MLASTGFSGHYIQDDSFFVPIGGSSIPVFAEQPLKPKFINPIASRCSSMLNDIASPKPLKIYPNTPPNSKRLAFRDRSRFDFPAPSDDN
jgi:hypothetical protein